MNNSIEQFLAQTNLPIDQIQEILAQQAQQTQDQQEVAPGDQIQNNDILQPNQMESADQQILQNQLLQPQFDQPVEEQQQEAQPPQLDCVNEKQSLDQIQCEENKDMENQKLDGEISESQSKLIINGQDQQPKIDDSNVNDQQQYQVYHINANVNQIAMLNKMLPKGFKFDIQEVVKRQTEQHLKRTSGLANFQKKPEILNEKRQQKIFQKYQQKREREKQKLEKKQSNIKDTMEMNEMIQSQENKDNAQNQVKESQNYILTKNSAKLTKNKSVKDVFNLSHNQPVDSEQQAQFESQKKVKPEQAQNQELLNKNKDKKSIDQNKQIIENLGKKKDKGDIEQETNVFQPILNQNTASKVANPNIQILENFQTQSIPLNNQVIDENQQEQTELQPVINNSVQIDLGLSRDLDNLQPEKKKRGRKPGSTKEKLAAAKQGGSSIQQFDDDQTLQDKNGKKSKKKQDQIIKEDSFIDENDLISEGVIADVRGKKGSIFADIDMSKFNVYDKYYKLLVSIVTHEELYKLGDVPLFLKVPNEQSKFYNQMKQENDGVGYLNFNMILQRLKSKKYGPGKNLIKESDLQYNIRNVFRICQKYYSYDPLSMKISGILEQHFEKQLAQCPEFKNQSQNLNNENNKKKDGLLGQKRGSQIGSIDDDMPDMQFDEICSIYSNEEKRRKREKKKDKKDKKDKKRKKQKGSDSSEDSDDQQNIKQRLYEQINNHLSVEQKKGIIPIVFNLNSDNPNIQEHQSTYEFDLFGLEPHVCKKLEQYVQECVKKNYEANRQEVPDETRSEPLKGHNDVQNQQGNDFDIKDQIQNQIDQKLKEHYMYEDNNKNDMSLTAQMQKAIQNQNTNASQPPNYVDENTNSPYDQDRYALIQKINSLDHKQLRGIVPIVKDYQAGAGGEDEQKLEFDLYDLPDIKCKQLHNYVEKCLLETREAQQKAVQEMQIKEQIRLLMEQQKSNNNQDLLQQQLKYQQQLQQEIYGQDGLNCNQNQNQQANLQQQLQQVQMMQQQSINDGLNQQQLQVDQHQQNLIQIEQQLQQQQNPDQFQNQVNQQIQDDGTIGQQQIQQLQQQLQNQNQIQQQNPQQQPEFQQPQQDLQNLQTAQNILNQNQQEQVTQQQRIEVSKVLQSLDQDKLDLLGRVMLTQDYISLQDNQDVDQGLKQTDQQIELDLQKLNKKQILFLQAFATNPQVQEAYKQKLFNGQVDQNQDDQKEAKLANQNVELNQEIQKKLEEETKKFEAIQQQIKQQMESQIQQLQETQIMMQQMAQIQQQQGGTLQGEQQQQLNQLINNDIILQNNISQLQQYKSTQDQQFEQTKEQILQLGNVNEQQNKPVEESQRSVQSKNRQELNQQQVNQNLYNGASANFEQQNLDKEQAIPADNQHIQNQNNQNIQATQAEQTGNFQQPNAIQQQVNENNIAQNDSNAQLLTDSNQIVNQNEAQNQFISLNEQENAKKQLQDVMNELINQYKVNREELDKKLTLSQQLQQVYMQISQQHQQMQTQNIPDEDKRALVAQMQQINDNLNETQNQIEKLAANQQILEVEILKVENALKQIQPANDETKNAQSNQNPEFANQMVSGAAEAIVQQNAEGGQVQTDLQIQGQQDQMMTQDQAKQQALQQQALQQLQQQIDTQQFTPEQQAQLTQQYLLQLQQEQNMAQAGQNDQMNIQQQQTVQQPQPEEQAQIQRDNDQEILQQNQQQMMQTPFNTQIN